MKTLKTIQTISKVSKIICEIVFICCLVGGIGCALGIISLALIPESFKIGDVTFKNFVEQSADVSLGTCYASMAAAIVICAGEAVLAKIAQKYFVNELKAGNPFTFDGSKEMMVLGIYTICIPLGSNIIASIVYGILKAVLENVDKFDSDILSSVSVGLGIMFVVTGLLCRYGAELKESKEESKDITE